MQITRRQLIQSGAVITGAVALTDMALSPAAWATAGPVAPQHTTLTMTLVRGTAGVGGYAPVVQQSGEPHTVRTDLGVPASSNRRSTRTPILAFAT